MTFNELLALVSSGRFAGQVCRDCRLVKAGDIFVAVAGTVYDGYDFIAEAIAKGATFIVCDKTADFKGAEIIVVQDCAEAMGLLAQAAQGRPASKLVNLAVTGTNGKTTVTFLVRSVIQQANHKCGLIGTIVYDAVSNTDDSTLTTPDAILIAKLGRQIVDSGAKFMVIEASSHAIAQNRLAGVNFKAAAFTNLTGDHLDYHRTTTDYLAAKMKLFEGLATDGVAVLNRESPASQQIAEKTNAKILWYGIDTETDIAATIESMDASGTVFTLTYQHQTETIRTSLPGRHNVSNLLAAAGLALAAGFDLPTAAAGLAALKKVPGRLEPVDCGQDFVVLVDYAHTDDALKNVLATLKPLCKGKLTVVFGCGGDRDSTKRPRMAKVAEELADVVIVTSDNPRTEDAEKIIKDIATGFERPDSKSITIEPDRKKAIELAITSARKDDIILIAGKGHETYQIIGTEKFKFSDKAVTESFLQERMRCESLSNN